MDPLKYQTPPQPTRSASPDELVTVKLRYKAPMETQAASSRRRCGASRRPLTANLGFASAVAEVGMLVRASKHAGSGSFASAIARASKFRGADGEGYRSEFIKLAGLASSLRGPARISMR